MWQEQEAQREAAKRRKAAKAKGAEKTKGTDGWVDTATTAGGVTSLDVRLVGRLDQWLGRINGFHHLLIHGVLLGLYSYNPLILTFVSNLQRDIQVVGKFSEMQVVYRD